MSTYLPAVRPACCICDPARCAADDTGEYCNDKSCGSCLHGCPAPAGECCDASAEVTR
ncbi:hypothetical protein ACFOOK_28275 [Micromonospora krabiensis]|uniref:Uncharacterized protein n=1 Tax=Micromonospora krabiensis TaxID=307121 RepID=A0A1C3N4N9_9ACTN|nr:hypothetical protein [Micromonospora krabiensis]SBV27533.1 hypothetical protein GA0070620_3057 [Micromonospora krabiensis]